MHKGRAAPFHSAFAIQTALHHLQPSTALTILTSGIPVLHVGKGSALLSCQHQQIRQSGMLPALKHAQSSTAICQMLNRLQAAECSQTMMLSMEGHLEALPCLQPHCLSCQSLPRARLSCRACTSHSLERLGFAYSACWLTTHLRYHPAFRQRCELLNYFTHS